MMKFTIKPWHITVAIIILLTSAVFFIALQVWTANNPVTIYIVPKDAKVFVNNSEIVGNRTNLANGTYTLRVTKDGFTAYENKLIIDDNNKYIDIALAPESEDAKKWAEKNVSLYLEHEKTVESNIKESGKEFLDVNPIAAKLPIKNYTYSIGYILDQGDTTGKSIIVTVDSYDGYRNAAIKSILDQGFDPGEYAIRFKNLNNPFVSTEENAQ